MINYTDDEKALIWLTMSGRVSVKKYLDLKKYIDTPSDLLNSNREISLILDQCLGKTSKEALYSVSWEVLNSFVLELNRKNITCITLLSKNYPKKLLQLEEPPIVLYAKGDTSLLGNISIGVVGTRRATSYGKNVTEKFVRGFTSAGFVVISGLAYGIDTCAHQAAINSKGKTLAVLGGGFNHIYPASNTNLCKSIVSSGGLVLSEYPPELRPSKQSFPFRNRIIAALSDALFIPEAGDNSGSMHTKNFALDLGRNVYVVPGRITDPESSGTNRIIRNGHGQPVLDVSDILSDFNVDIATEEKVAIQLNFEEEMIYNCLKSESKTLDLIAFETKLDIKKLNSCLTTLQIRGIITKLPGNAFMLK